jgi:signal transduction histidine kinase/ligand-binding sensor domain-containing protein/DNA-binding response OmpR family regulator
MLQDSRGFLWIGTYIGLNKYDGYKFTIYKNSQVDSSSISENKIRALCEDKNGNIWIGTWGGGLDKFNCDTEKFMRYRHNPDDPSSLSADGILSMCFDKSGNLWIGTEGGGLDYFNPEKATFTHYKNDPNDPNSISDNSIYSVYLDKNGTLWCGTAKGGLNKFLFEKKQFVAFKYSSDNLESISGNLVVTIFEDRFSNLWIGTLDAGLNKFNPSTNKFTRYLPDPNNPNSLSDAGVWVVYEDSNGLLWVGNYSYGLNLFDRKRETFTSYRKNYYDLKSLSDDGIFSIYEDRSGVLWIGTWSGGLNKYDKEKEKFLTYSHNPNNDNSLSADGVFAIYKDKYGILWVGTEAGGLNRIDEKNNEFTHYLHNPNDPTSISSDNVFSICEDKEGHLWVGTDNAGLNIFDRRTNKFQHFYHDPDDPKSISDNEISQIFCDSYGDLWIATTGSGLDRLKRKQKSFIHYVNKPGDPKSVSEKMIYAFYEDKSGNIWIGTFGGGLMMYNRSTDDFCFYKYDPKNFSNSLSSNIISSICEDENDILWVGTNGSGLNKFDRRKNKFKHYRESDGLANDVIYGILKDDKGNLWISTGSGISRFNIKNETFRNYDVRDGLQGNDFNQWAYFRDANGKMYFGGVNGLNVFRPEEITDNPHRPQIVITDFQLLHKTVSIGYDTLWNRTILHKSITETKLIELKHDDNIISFEFAALDFKSPEKNQYSYILEGFDKDWNYTTASRRFVTYTNLDAGEYNFRVKGSNNDGVWNEAGTSLMIIIHHPWWATWWAYILYGIVITLAGFSIRGYDLKRQRLKHQLELEHEHAEKLNEVDEMKSRFFANISHEFRTPLTLILGPVKDIIDKSKDTEIKRSAGLIKRNAGKLLGLVNQLLDLSKLEAGRMKLETREENIIPLLKGLVLSFSSFAERKKITLKFNTIEDDVRVYLDRDKIEKIINNLLSNAFKFTTDEGRIDVTVEKQIKEVEIRISDNGIGIPKEDIDKIFDRFYQVDGSHTREQEGTGIGLALTKELVELHKGKIEVESEAGNGTTFIVTIPLGKDYLKPEEIIEEKVEGEMRLPIGDTELADEITSRKETTDIDVLLDSDKPLLLVVEDNTDVRKYIISHLEDNYRIQEAIDGEDGLQQAFNHIPDLIISDVMMPKMDGFEMCNKLKSDERTSHIPIIMLTAKATSQDKISGYELGADDYIMKPFEAAELKARIKNLIEIRRKLQEKFRSNDYTVPAELSSIDEQFIKRVLNVINEHISEEEFSIDELGKEVAMSRQHLYRKLKAISDKTPSLFIRSVKLAKAKKLIKERKGTISEISFSVGFNSPAYFNRCFKEEFGYSPGELIQ